MMLCCNSLLLSSCPTRPPLIHTITHPPPSRGLHNLLTWHSAHRQRGVLVVSKAGPGTGSYIFAFVFPLSLLAVTIFTSIKVADRLDQKFFEEIAVDPQSFLEGEENDGEVNVLSEEEQEEAKPLVTPTRARNRPKREVDRSST